MDPATRRSALSCRASYAGDKYALNLLRLADRINPEDAKKENYALRTRPGLIVIICCYNERLLDPSPGPQLSNHCLATRTGRRMPWISPYIEAACTEL